MLLPIFLSKRLALWMGVRKGTSSPAVNCCLTPTDEAEAQNDKNNKRGFPNGSTTQIVKLLRIQSSVHYNA